MAKFTPGPAVAEVRGSVGGTTFTRNRYGAIMRFRAKPVVSQSAAAVEARARMTRMTQAWGGQSEATKLAWNQWADANPIIGSLGFQQALTGHAAFCGVNNRLEMMGQAIISAPPITPAPNPLSTMTVAPDGTLNTCDVTYTATPTGAADILWITACQTNSGGKYWVENLLRGNIFSGVAEASPFDAYAAIAARIGDLTVGAYLHIKVFVASQTTGLLSAPLRARAIIV